MTNDPGLPSICGFVSRYWAKRLAELGTLPPVAVDYYARRAEMDGEVVKATGEVIPKESV